MVNKNIKMTLRIGAISRKVLVAFSGMSVLIGAAFWGASGVNAMGVIGEWGPGAGVWTNVGAATVPGQASAVGMNNTVYGLGMSPDGTFLYAGGAFTNAGGVGCNRVAQFDGTNWMSMSNGVNYYANVTVVAPARDGVMYAGGYFTNIGGVVTRGIGKWTGTNWVAMGAGLTFRPSVNGYVNTIVAGTNDEVYAGGYFTNAMDEGVMVNYIAKWTGNSWTNLGIGMSNVVICLALAPNGHLYAGGPFRQAGGCPVDYIAEWTGTGWTNLANGLNNRVTCMTVASNGDLYVGGWFTSATNSDGVVVDAKYVAKWNGVSWTNLGGGFNNWVYALQLDKHGNLYAGGAFTTADVSVAASRVAKWDGVSWSNMGDGVNDSVLTLSVDDHSDTVYAGGFFKRAGTCNAWYVARWIHPLELIGTGVMPSSGSWTGGYSVVISGTNMCDGTVGDVASVTLCGVTSTVTGVSGSTQIVVTAASSLVGAQTGAVVVVSASCGQSVVSNAFRYSASGLRVLGSDGAAVLSGGVASRDNGTELGPVVLGGAVTNVFAVTNAGNEAVTILDVAETDADSSFEISALPVTLAVGAATNFTVCYKATSIGEHVASLIISNDSPVATYTVNLAGSCYSLSSQSGPLAGGNTITITNGNFGTITNVLVGGVKATIEGSGANWVRIILPAAGSPGVKDIVVQTSDNGAFTLAGAYSVNFAGRITGSIKDTVSMGNSHVLAIKPDRSVIGWGTFDSGRCTVPAPNADFVAVSAGDVHSLGLKADGTISAWGFNGSGACDVPAPNSGFVAVAAGIGHSLGLKADGTVVAWGGIGFDMGQTNVPAPNADFIAVSAGGGFSLGLKADGSIVAWGDPSDGRCAIPAPNANFTAIDAGGSHALGLKVDGSIVAWGNTNQGQCNVPAPNTNFVAVAAGANHSAGLKADGSIVAWGFNAHLQCDVPAPNSHFVAVSADVVNTLGVKDDGSVLVMGANFFGQTNVPPPNSGFGSVGSGVIPNRGTMPGGYLVEISGSNLCSSGDVVDVSLCGVPVQSVVTQSATRILVVAAAGPAGVGHVRVNSTSYGETVASNAFTYLASDLQVLAPTGTLVTNGGAATLLNGTEFSCQLTGTVAVQFFTLTNSGTLAMDLTGFAVSDSHFSLSGMPASLEPGAASNVMVRFAADEVGDYAAVWAITNDSPSGLFIVNLAGSCYALSTSNGPYAGGNTLTITNGIFGSITNVLVGGVPALIQGAGSNWVTITLPATGVAGLVDILVQTSDHGGILLGGAYSVNVAGQIGWGQGPNAWTNMGAGMDFVVARLIRAGTNLYAGGMFDYADGQPVKNIAQWDGTAWMPLGDGVNDAVYTLVHDGTNLYAAGMFTNAGGVEANHVAMWNGVSWTNLGSGMDGDVTSLVCVGTNLYAGGLFTQAGGVAANYVAMWNGSVWTNVGSGVGDKVDCLAHDGTNLYAGGAFTDVDGLAANYVAMWNGSTWTNLGVGLNAEVMCLLHDGRNLYAGGFFFSADGYPANYVAMWNGVNWTNLGAGVDGAVWTLAHDGTNLYAGGEFDYADDVEVDHVAMWNGSSWTNLGTGMDSSVVALTHDGTNLYAGGWFSRAGYAEAYCVAQWGISRSENFGVSPVSGVSTGGYQVVISGENLGDGADITSVSLCGVPVSSIVSQTTDHVVIVAGSTSFAGTGDVRVVSTSFGETVKSNAFSYYKLDQTISFPAVGMQAVSNLIGLAASASSGYPVSYSLLTGAGSFSSGTNLLLLTPGLVTIVASQAGDSLYNAAVSVTNVVNVYAVTLAFGPYAGGNSVLITNGYFGVITNVLVGGVGATITGSGPDWVTVTMPAVGSGGAKDVIVQTAGQGDVTLPGAYMVCVAGAQLPVGAVVFDADTQWGGVPIQWRIVHTNYGGVSGSVTLQATNSVGLRAFNDGWDNRWQWATLRNWLNSSNFYGQFAPGFSGVVLRTSVPWALSNPQGAPASGTSMDSVFIASRTELGGDLLAGDGTVLDWYSDPGTSVARRIGPALYYWTRTGERGWYGAWYDLDAFLVNVPSGDFTGGNWVTDGFSIIPMLNLNGVAQFAPQPDGSYRFAFPVVQALTFPDPGPQFVSNTVSLAASALSGLPVTFSVLSGPVTLTDGTNLAFTGVGLVQVIAHQAGNAYWDPVSVTNSFLVSKMDQAISFTAIGDQWTTNHVALAASVPSGLSVSFAVGTGPAVISDGTNLTFSGAGTVEIVASQAGTTNWNAATDVTNTFMVNKTPASVTLSNLVQTYSGSPCIVPVTTVPAGLTVELLYEGSSNAPTAAGSYAITAAVNEVMYQGSATGLLVVAKRSQIITFPSIGAQVTTNVVELGATSGSGFVVGYSVISGPASLLGSNLTFTTAGTVSIVATQSGDSDWAAAPEVTNTFSVTKVVASVTLDNLSQVHDGSARLVTASPVPTNLVVDITYNGSSWAPTNAGSYAVTGTVNDLIWQGVQTGTLVIARGLDVITFSATNQVFDGSAKPVTALSDSGESVAVTYDGGAGAPVDAGGYAVTAIVDTANWMATNTTWLTIAKADQVITNFLPVDGMQFVLGSSTTLSAQASSGLAVTFSNLTPGICSLAGLTITFTNLGLASVQVEQVGNSNWNPVAAIHDWRVGGLITNLSRYAANVGGGVTVVVQGLWLGNGSDITNVTLAGVGAEILTQTVHDVTVLANAATGAITGDVVLESGTGGFMMQSNAFSYLAFAAPVMLDPVDITTSNLVARWTVPGAAQSVRLDAAADTNFAGYLTGYEKLDVALASQYPVGGLSNGQWVALRVFAWDTNGFSLPSATNWVPASTNTPYETHPPVGGPVTVGAVMEHPVSNMFFGAGLIYTAESSDTNVMVVSIVDGFLRMDPRNAGSAVITVRATEPGTGYVSTYSFWVQVVSNPAILSNAFRVRELWNARFDQLLTVQNTSGLDAIGVRLLFTNLMPGITVENRTGTSWDGRPMIEQEFVFTNGATQVMSVAYLCAGAYRADSNPPQIEVQYILPAWQAPLPGEGTSVSGYMMTDGSGRFILRFDTVVGGVYAIEYMNDFPAGAWMQVPLRLRASANRSQWIDAGPPATLPVSGVRVYRVKQLVQ